MALKVVQSPMYEDLRDRENCCICFVLTSYWYTPKDVALCPDCAKHTRRADVPTKDEWFKWVELRRKMRAPSMGRGVNARAHWEREAKKLVVELLYRASMVDTRSIIGTLASKRLVELAVAEDPEILKEVIETRDRCVAGMGRIMADIINS